MTENRAYLKEQLRESLKVVDTCLGCIYAGEFHMYRALAGQLRILLCDTQRRRDNSLIVAVYPQLEISALQSISWSPHQAGPLRLQQSENGPARIAQMPFEITRYANGLSVADLQVDVQKMLPIGEWCNQPVTYHPTALHLTEIIRSVADKGGGAHVDMTLSPALRHMRTATPVGETYAQLLIVAIGRFIQALGEHLFSYKGCRVSPELTNQEHEKYNLGIIAHEGWSASRASHP